jgi:hypothetical protein
MKFGNTQNLVSSEISNIIHENIHWQNLIWNSFVSHFVWLFCHNFTILKFSEDTNIMSSKTEH